MVDSDGSGPMQDLPFGAWLLLLLFNSDSERDRIHGAAKKKRRLPSPIFCHG